MRCYFVALLALAACRKESVPAEIVDGGPPPKRGTAAGCEALFDSARQALVQTIPSARPCKTADDCEVVDTGGCIGTCGTHAVPRAAASAVHAKQKEVWDKTCKTWMDDDCMRITPKPMASCATPSAACKGGSCELVPWAPPR